MRAVQLDLFHLMDPLNQSYLPWFEDAPKVEKKSKHIQVAAVRWSRFRKQQGQFESIYKD